MGWHPHFQTFRQFGRQLQRKTDRATARELPTSEHVKHQSDGCISTLFFNYLRRWHSRADMDLRMQDRGTSSQDFSILDCRFGVLSRSNVEWAFLKKLLVRFRNV